MAYTDADLAAVRAAIATGERVVVIADRSTTYRSIEELRQAEQLILNSLQSTESSTRRSKQTRMVASKGF